MQYSDYGSFGLWLIFVFFFFHSPSCSALCKSQLDNIITTYTKHNHLISMYTFQDDSWHTSDGIPAYHRPPSRGPGSSFLMETFVLIDISFICITIILLCLTHGQYTNGTNTRTYYARVRVWVQCVKPICSIHGQHTQNYNNNNNN